MKKRIIEALTIDNFITYQNGNLVNDFKTINTNDDKINDIDEKYKSTKLYSKINKSSEAEIIYYKNVVTAFENFINYLNL
jgi:hypothetical protein